MIGGYTHIKTFVNGASTRRSYLSTTVLMSSNNLIQKKVSLQNLNTFRVGGCADYFCRVSSIEEIKEAILFSREKKVPYFVLGGGSNILISDTGFPGLVIKNELKGVEYEELPDGYVRVVAGAGEEWDNLVKQTVATEAYGLENLSLIPGSVGASPVQNIGAYGTEVSEKISEVTAFDSEKLLLKKFSNADCGFSYRNSIFKQKEGRRYIITSVAFNLSKKEKPNTNYQELRNFFEERRISKPTGAQVREAVISIRKNKLPDVREISNAGSFFKNPLVSARAYDLLKKKYPDIPGFSGADGRVKIALAWALDHVCGLKGLRRDNVGLYKNQPLVLVNFGGATEKEISVFAKDIAKIVKEKTGIKIEREVQKIF